MMRKALLASAVAFGLSPAFALAQGTTSGPAAGTNVQPGTAQGQGGQMPGATPNPSGAAGAGAPGTAGRPGTEAGPNPGSGAGMQGMPQPQAGGPGQERPGMMGMMGREHAGMEHGMGHHGWMGPGAMSPGAFFRFRHGDNEIVIKCAANEPTQVCVQAAAMLMEMVKKESGAPGQAH